MRRMRGWFKGLIAVGGCAAIAVAIQHSHRSHVDETGAKHEHAPLPAAASDGSDLERKSLHHALDQVKKEVADQEKKTGDRAVAARRRDAESEPGYERIDLDQPSDPDICGAIEYRGPGPLGPEVTSKEWTQVMDAFHDSKRGLMAWLNAHRSRFPEPLASRMEDRIRQTKIQRPPTSDMPDLAWRGIGVFTHSTEDGPVIKLGGGFVSLVVKHPARGKFELTRLLAQSWAPCELRAGEAKSTTSLPLPWPWEDLTSCLGIAEKGDPACAAGSYSEAAWAVSSAVAAVVSPPGCSIPAFSKRALASVPQGDDVTPDPARCLKDLRGGVKTASIQGSGAKEVRK